jgi:protein phosphatase
LRESSERAEFAGMGTTVVAVLASDDRLAVVGVGDSRVYMWHGGTLEQITRDDSWVATVLAREPGMTDQALARHPMRHVLTSVIGARADTDPEVQEHEFGPGDILLLCSDGLHGAMDSSEAAAIFAAGGSVEEMTNALVHHALARGASDNVTAVVIRREA